jgi:hypothetical protein
MLIYYFCFVYIFLLLCLCNLIVIFIYFVMFIYSYCYVYVVTVMFMYSCCYVYLFWYVYVFLLLRMLCSVYSVLIVPTGTLRLPWLRFFPAFSSAVRHMPGNNSQRQVTARTLTKLIVLFCVLCVCVCVCVCVYCTAATGCQPNCS